MSLAQDRNELACRFGKDAEFARSDAMRDLERSVCGCDYGSTSWTTRLEAERIAELLELRPAAKLLDVGAGSGWPGLYLAQLAGCNVVLVDLPLVALQAARERATADGLTQRCEVVVADGAALPFEHASFDALSHSDVLCCTPDKLAVLRGCRRVARAGARMVFTVIAPAPSLADSERQIAIECGPPFVDVPDDYAVLLDHSGWCLQERMDLTAEFLQSMRTHLEGMQARAGALAAVFSSDELTERMKHRQATITAVGAGLLRRELFVARTGH
ncbi:SAM-dependent methyltransferase [Paraburkholderia sp. WC7.3g]|uniref:class I SAM-dependent methyltransferase n=1 Tax=Paraburkholderia sp. WC7.3g TaxID=2991070 RepID=UPI003D1A6F20